MSQLIQCKRPLTIQQHHSQALCKRALYAITHRSKGKHCLGWVLFTSSIPTPSVLIGVTERMQECLGSSEVTINSRETHLSPRVSSPTEVSFTDSFAECAFSFTDSFAEWPDSFAE